MSEPHVKRYMDGSMTTNAASTSIIITTSKQSEVNNARHQVGSSPNGRDMSETSDFIGGVEDNNSVTTVGLEFVVDLPKRISTGVLAIRRVSCTAFVGDIYKAVTYANVSIVDRRWAKAVATVRTPSHLLHSSSKIIILLWLLLSLLSPAQALLGSLLSLHQHLWMDPIHYGVAITCI